MQLAHVLALGTAEAHHAGTMCADSTATGMMFRVAADRCVDSEFSHMTEHEVQLDDGGSLADRCPEVADRDAPLT
jgi:hypothetical protein